MRTSSEVDSMSRAITISSWSRDSADFAPTHGKALPRTRARKRSANGRELSEDGFTGDLWGGDADHATQRNNAGRDHAFLRGSCWRAARLVL